MKVHELLDSQEKWVKGCAAMDKNGNSVPAYSSICWQRMDSAAVRWCLYGASKNCYWNDHVMFGIVLSKIMDSIQTYDICAWNDHPDRTFDEVRALALELDI